MLTIDHRPSEDDLWLRGHILSLTTNLGIWATDCTIDAYLGASPTDSFTLRFPGGSATGSYRQMISVLTGEKTFDRFVADCWVEGILDATTP